MKFKAADEEFSEIAKELFDEHEHKLNLMVDPSRVLFLRSEKKKKNAYAYCKVIRGEYEFLTNKRFFIVIVSENFDALLTDKERKYVILHELKHLYYDDEKETYALLKHSLQDFHQLLVNPSWNLELITEKES